MTVARTIDAVEALRPRFERLPPDNLDADLDVFLTVVRHREAVIRPHVVFFELADGREMAVVARLEHQRGFTRFPGRPLRRLQVALGGVIGADTAAASEFVVHALRDILADNEADVVALPQIGEGTALYRVARSGVPWWRVDHMPARSVHWCADVPDSLETFIGSRGKNTRNNLRRYSKQLIRAYGDALAVREFSEPMHLDRLSAGLQSITATSYQRGLGVGYTGDVLQLALMELAAQRGWLRARVLYIADTPVAFVFGYCYRGTFYLIATSFDPAYSRQHVGLYVQMQLMEGLCREGDVRLWDFGSGEAEYKQRLGDRRLNEAEVLLFGPSMRAVGHNASRTARVAASSAAKRWIAKSELGGRVKKSWRKNAERRARALTKDR
jgi:hypothetical protein